MLRQPSVCAIPYIKIRRFARRTWLEKKPGHDRNARLLFVSEQNIAPERRNIVADLDLDLDPGAAPQLVQSLVD